MNNVRISPVVSAEAIQPGGHYSVRRLNLKALGNTSFPIMGFEHYRMSGKTFSPRPYAGQSIISYVLEESVGALKSRNSLSGEVVVESGDVLWSRASSGLIYEEFPEKTGVTVDGLQIFVNMKGRNKCLPPEVCLIKAEDTPIIEDAYGNRIKVLCGEHLGLSSKIKQTEKFDLLEVIIHDRFQYSIPADRNFLIYVIDGVIEIECAGENRSLNSHQAIAGTFGGNKGAMVINTAVRSRILICCGTDPKESIVTYGSFILNSESEIIDALDRYRNGKMGRVLVSKP